MKRKSLYIFLGLLFIANVVLLYMILTKVPSKNKPQRENFLTQELQFSKQQKDQFFLLDMEHRNAMRSIDEELRGLRRQLFDSYEDKSFSLDSITNKIGNLESSKNKELYLFFKKVRGLCNVKQTIKFDEIIEKILQKRGPKPSKESRKSLPR